MAEKKPGPDWRNANKRNAGASPAAGAGKRDWQKQSTPSAGPRKPWSRGSKLFLGLGLLSLFFGGVYVVILLLRPIGPACLVLMGASYDENLAVPHNAYSWKNLEDLGKLKDVPDLFTEKGRPSLLYRSPELKGADIWKKEWDVLAPKIRSSREKTVVLYLALHGAADSKDAYFFLNDDHGFARLPLTDLLKALAGDDLRDKNVVLILEPALSRANWSAGVLENNFVAKLVEKTKDRKNLFILCASDANQVSWPSEEWQQTVFGHYLIEGLRGAADGSIDGSRNSRVTALELFDYVKKSVVAWSHVNRAIEQTPIFIGDESEAGLVEIVQVSSPYQERDGDVPGLDFRVPESLENAWTEWNKARTRTPRPAVYSPALWRRYQDLLVRYEQLLRAGDPTKKADDIAGNLAGMNKKLEGEARFDAADATLSLALPMPEALGVPLPLNAVELHGKLKQVWEAVKIEERPKVLQEAIAWSKSIPDVKAALMQVQSHRDFLDFVTRNPLVQDADLVGRQSDLDPRSKVAALLDLYEVHLGSPRPAEVHYLAMLVKDVSRDSTPDFDLLRQSLAIRRLAERTALSVPDSASEHAYSEIVFPWNRGRVLRADAARRTGEDYLFATSKDDWEKGRRLLKQAEAGYREAQTEAKHYRKALETRDNAYALMPYFALWVANQRALTDKSRAESIEKWGAQVERLAARARILQEELDKDKGAMPSSSKLADCIAQVDDSLKNVIKSMEDDIDDVRRVNDTHDLWFNREALLSVPPLLVDVGGTNAVVDRQAMLNSNRQVSAVFHKSFKEKAAAKFIRGNSKEDADIAAKRNLTMATAACKGFFREQFASIEGDGASAVGEALGEIMKSWPVEISDAAARSSKESELGKAALALYRADFLSRGLPGGFDAKSEPMSASRALRCVRMHDLLVAMARRTTMDHWFSEDGKPYYEKAALGFLNVARQLVEVKGVESRDANKMRTASCDALIEAVKTEVKLSIVGKAKDYWTSQKEFLVLWTVKVPNDPYLVLQKGEGDPKMSPLGVAVTKRELIGPGLWKDEASNRQRMTLALDTQESLEIPTPFYLTKSESDAPLKTKYTVLLRGQSVWDITDISQKKPDLIVHDFPRPNQSYIKVRMHPEFTYGAVSIALDISGSMIWKKAYGIGKEPSRKTRLEYAKEALRTALDFVPDGTHVSVLAFVTDNGEKKPRIAVVRESKQWNRNKQVLDGLIDQIENLAKGAWEENPKNGSLPYGSTPMAFLLRECHEKGFPRPGIEVRGPRVILALGDGGDTSTGQMLGQNWPNPETEVDRYNKKVRSFLNDELSDKDVEVHFVCFLDKDSKDFQVESRIATAQFGGVEEFKNKGYFVINTEPLELAEQLKNSLRPRLIVAQGNEKVRGFHDEGVFASLPKEEAKLHSIPPGDYQISVKPSTERNLKVGPGDIVGIVLKRDPNDKRKVIYEREILAELVPETSQLFGDLPSALKPYRISVVQNDAASREQKKLLMQLIAVEEVSKTGVRVQQTAPPFTWIETKPKTSPPLPQMMRWYRDFGYSALTYRMLGYDWPAPAGNAVPAEVSVWLTDNPTNPGFAKPLVRSLKAEKSSRVELLADEFAIVEYARLEDKEVIPSGAGEATAKPVFKQCLVVRVVHATDRPVLIQFDGLHRGEEHHFFHTANTCTAFFWDLTNPDDETLRFNVIFLDAMRKNVTPTTFSISRFGRHSLQQKDLGN